MPDQNARVFSSMRLKLACNQTSILHTTTRNYASKLCHTAIQNIGQFTTKRHGVITQRQIKTNCSIILITPYINCQLHCKFSVANYSAERHLQRQQFHLDRVLLLSVTCWPDVSPRPVHLPPPCWVIGTGFTCGGRRR